MNESLESAKARYQSVPLPEELSFAVASAVRKGETRGSHRRAARRVLATAVAACASFALLVNVSPGFASAVSDVPVLGQIARIFTVTEYAVSDQDHLIDVRLPALENTGNSDLEQRINTEIRTRISGVLEEAELRSSEVREAFVQTGGKPEDFIPIIINVDYEIKSQSEQYLSFVLNKTETLASAYTESFTYNIDLETGTEVTLLDLLGPEYQDLANAAVRAGIEERSKDPNNLYFDGENGVEGFVSIREDQAFYINQAGNPVILFDKYEIAPGYMGYQEFEVKK